MKNHEFKKTEKLRTIKKEKNNVEFSMLDNNLINNVINDYQCTRNKTKEELLQKDEKNLRK